MAAGTHATAVVALDRLSSDEIAETMAYDFKFAVYSLRNVCDIVCEVVNSACFTCVCEGGGLLNGLPVRRTAVFTILFDPNAPIFQELLRRRQLGGGMDVASYVKYNARLIEATKAHASAMRHVHTLWSLVLRSDEEFLQRSQRLATDIYREVRLARVFDAYLFLS